MRWYKLDGKIPVLCNDLLMAAVALEDQDRTVRVTETELYKVSTVFLGLDHNHYGFGDPLLFETLVFRRLAAEDQEGENVLGIFSRYSTWDEAEVGHSEALEQVAELERVGRASLRGIGKITLRIDRDDA